MDHSKQKITFLVQKIVQTYLIINLNQQKKSLIQKFKTKEVLQF